MRKTTKKLMLKKIANKVRKKLKEKLNLNKKLKKLANNKIKMMMIKALLKKI